MKSQKAKGKTQPTSHVVQRLRALNEGIDVIMYVSDPKTYKILFANEKTKEQFGKDIEGKECHKVFRNRGKPCPSCSNKEIFGKNLGKTFVSDHQNPWNKRWYRGISKAIQWADDRHVRYGIAIDITDHKATEEALRESEEKFRLFAENAIDLIYRYSAEKGFEYVNPASTRMTGYTPEEHYRDPKLGLAIVHPEDRRKVQRIQQDLKAHRPPDNPAQIRWLHKKGGIVVTEQINVPIYDQKGKLIGIEGVARDITERIGMEEALKDSENRYRALFEDSPVSLWEFDMSEVKKHIDNLRQSDIKDLKTYFEDHPETVIHLANHMNIVTVNNATLKLFEAKTKNQLFKSMFENFGFDEDEAFREVLVSLARGETTFKAEMTTSTLTGKKIHLATTVSIAPDCESTLSKVFISMIDISRQKKMEEALRASEETFRSVVDNSHNAILILDDKFHIVYANAETQRLGGYSKDELARADFTKFIDKKSLELVLSRYAKRLKGIETPSQYKLTIARKDGEKRDVEIRAVAIVGHQGKIRILAQLLDITQRQKLEMERKRFEERLSALNKYGQNLNMAKSLDEIYSVTLEAMRKTLGFEYASILKVEGKTLKLTRNQGYSKNFSLRLPLDGCRGVTVKAARSGKSILIDDLRNEKEYIVGKPGMLSELAVPIKEGSKLTGILNVESERLGAFNEEDKKLLEILASHTATAVTNLNKQERLSALNEYGQDLNMAESLNEVYMLTLNAMEKTLGFEFATFFVAEEKKLRLVAHRGYPKRLRVYLPLEGSEGVSVRAAREGKPIFVSDVRKEKAYVPGRPGMLSELAVPIKIGKASLGILNVESERLSAFGENDREMLEILASHAATSMGNLRRQIQLRDLSNKLEYLMKNTTQIMDARTMHRRLKVITGAIGKFGWRRVVISLRDENLEGTDTVTAGLSKKDVKLLMKRKAPGQVWRERLGPPFERFKIGVFYYLPWNDPWIRENVHGVPLDASPEEATTYAGVPSRLSPERMVDWHPQDMLYAPLRTPEGRVVGILSMDDPVDGRKPTRESLVPLELFLHQAAIIIENAQLIEDLREAREQLEQKVDERTRELKISQDQLLKAQRLAVIGELAGMVGHDLRNPLTSIAGATYYVKKRLTQQSDSKIEEMLELVEKNITYSNKIINDLLDYSREIKLDLTETTPATVVKEALALVTVPENIYVENLAENERVMKADTSKMKRCFVNVIKNAVDAMPNGGKLTIASKRTGGNVMFTFSDTGIGMSKNTITNLWTPLFTTKAKGMGFGLPICKRLVEAHGGAITATSTLKKGTTFTIAMPIEPATKQGGEEIWVKMPESSLLTTTKT